jgi:hypothetical protein
VPALPLALLPGLEQPAAEALFVAGITGAGLLAIGVACRVGRGEWHGRPRREYVGKGLAAQLTARVSLTSEKLAALRTRSESAARGGPDQTRGPCLPISNWQLRKHP